MLSAAFSTLNRLTEVESAATHSPGFAPIRRAILSPMRGASSIQPALFQLPIRSDAPFLRHHLLHARRRGLGHHAERVAVQVDQPGREGELLAQVRQRVGGVQRQGVFAGLHRLSSSRSTARTGLASALISFSGSAISS